MALKPIHIIDQHLDSALTGLIFGQPSKFLLSLRLSKKRPVIRTFFSTTIDTNIPYYGIYL